MMMTVLGVGVLRSLAFSFDRLMTYAMPVFLVGVGAKPFLLIRHSNSLNIRSG